MLGNPIARQAKGCELKSCVIIAAAHSLSVSRYAIAVAQAQACVCGGVSWVKWAAMRRGNRFQGAARATGRQAHAAKRPWLMLMQKNDRALERANERGLEDLFSSNHRLPGHTYPINRTLTHYHGATAAPYSPEDIRQEGRKLQTKMAEPDELFTLKNQLWIGNYQNAISEGGMLNHLRESLRNERDVYVYRAYLGLGNYELVLQSIPDGGNTPIALSAVKLLATYLSGRGDKEMIELTVKEWLADPASAENPHLLLIAGMIFAREGKLSDALSAFTKGGSLEHLLYIVHLYLQMDRIDLAQKQVQEMRKIEEDSTVTQLAQAWVMTLRGGDRADEATLHFQELADRFGATPLLLNGAAAAYMAMKNFVEAERLLLEALQKDQANEETLTNLIASSIHLNKPYHQYIAQLQQVAPANAWLANYARLDQDFSLTAANFS